MRHLFRTSLVVAVVLAASLAAPPAAQAETKPLADSVGIATLHPATLDITLVCADSIEPARAAAVIVASEQIAFDLARSDFSQTNRSIPTLREALQQRSLRPGRLFTDSNERRDQLRN